MKILISACLLGIPCRYDGKAKSEVKVWECRNCGHIVIGEKAPEICPTCNHPQSYFEIHAENY